MEKPLSAILLGIVGVGISMADILFGFQFLALAVPTGYAAWKWRQDYMRAKKKKDAPNAT